VRVLLLNQFFHPDLAAVAQMATDLAVDLAAAGLDVTAVASRGSYLGGALLPPTETYRGVRTVRVPCTSFGKGSLFGRVADYGSFYASAAARSAMEQSDVVIAMSTPPLVASIGAGLKHAKDTRLVYWVQDLYPELAVAFGVLEPTSTATRVFERASRLVLRSADAVVAIGGTMADRIERKGVPRERIHVIPNWADGSGIRPIPPESNPFRRAHGLDGKRVVLYSGNMGRGHDMTTLLSAAHALRDEQDVVFVFIGEGLKRQEVVEAAKGNPAIRLLPYQAREDLAFSLSAGDVHAVTQDANTDGLLEPSKLYGILAAGRPVLYIGPPSTEVARVVLDEGVGHVVANGDVHGAVSAIRRLLDDARGTGARARECLVNRHDRRYRTGEFLELLRRL
jgi:colanic acid biosynthesis glycosyl transferase WcaI